MTLPTSQRCPIGPLNLHTYNYERDECIWCGPNRLASKPGHWLALDDGTAAWSIIPAEEEDEDEDVDGAPVEQWEVTTPPEVYLTDEDD